MLKGQQKIDFVGSADRDSELEFVLFYNAHKVSGNQEQKGSVRDQRDDEG